MQRAPLWEINETFPGFGILAEKEAFKDTFSDGLITPRQLGPTTLTPALAHKALIFFSIAAPSPPTSLKPAETITIPLIPFAIQSLTACKAAFGGRIIIARSMGSGILDIVV